MIRRTLPLGLVASLAIFALCACGSSRPPREPEKPPIVLNTPADDRRAGKEASEGVAAEMGVLKSPALTAYVNEIGQRLARNAPSGRFQYTFQIVDQDVPNAFALPGGYIYISRGLLILSNSEDELANVIGHEIVHVARRHAAARQALMRDIPKIFQFTAMGQIAAYSRSQENEADRLGQGLAAVSGYDPEGLAQFLSDLEHTERLKFGFSRFTTYRDTHPATKERVAAAGVRARNIAWTRKPTFSRDRNDYLRRLNGLTVGTGGADGVFQGDRFLHADLDFSMRFPQGWRLVNTKQAVGAMQPQLKGYVALELQGEGDDPVAASEEYLADARADGLGVDTIEHVKIGQWDAVRVTGSVGTPGGPLSVHLTFIARNGYVYRLMGVARGRAGTLEGIFNSTARSFRPLTPREIKSIRETRLKIVPALAGESLTELGRRTGNTWNIQQTALMNAVYATDKLEAGQLMKVAISRPYRPSPKE